MATTFPTTPAGTVTVSLEKIHVPANVRELDHDHVDALAGSIALQGQLVPVLVSPAQGEIAEQGFEFELVAGFHRYAAVTKLQHGAIDAIVRDRDEQRDGAQVAAARATENIARKQLDAYEEALAVQAMLDRGLTEDGAAQALGWAKARVSARVKLLELPDNARKLVGDGVIPLSCVDTLRAVGEVSAAVLKAVVDYIADGNEWIVDRLHTDVGSVIGRALAETDGKTFVGYLTHVNAGEVEQLRLGKRAATQLAEIEQLHKQINRYSYGPAPIRFNESDVDQARAAGVLIESAGAPVIVDRPLYRELAKQALKRTSEQLREQAAQVAEERNAQKHAAASDRAGTEDPCVELRREHGRQTREFARQAHGVNLDLGWALRNGLATVEPQDINVARFFVGAALGADYHSGYGKTGELVCQLATSGIRLVIEEFRTDVTKTKKDGSRGALRIDYGDPHTPEDQVAWLWKFIDGARSAGELYGRALVVIAAEQYASRLVLPAGQQRPPLRWSSHKDQAAKALAKLAGPHLPVTLKQLEKAIARASAEYEQQLKALQTATSTATAAPDTAEPVDSNQQPGEADADVGDELDDCCGEAA